MSYILSFSINKKNLKIVYKLEVNKYLFLHVLGIYTENFKDY